MRRVLLIKRWSREQLPFMRLSPQGKPRRQWRELRSLESKDRFERVS